MLVLGQQVIEWVASHTEHCGNYGDAAGIGWERDGVLIAGVVFNDYNGANINMHVASDGSRHWMTRRYLWTCFDYPFNQAKVKRITGLVAEDNLDARRFDEHIGFRLETTLKDAHPTGDLLVYVMTRDMCRWIKHENLYQTGLRVAA